MEDPYETGDFRTRHMDVETIRVELYFKSREVMETIRGLEHYNKHRKATRATMDLTFDI